MLKQLRGITRWLIAAATAGPGAHMHKIMNMLWRNTNYLDKLFYMNSNSSHYDPTSLPFTLNYFATEGVFSVDVAEHLPQCLPIR